VLHLLDHHRLYHVLLASFVCICRLCWSVFLLCNSQPRRGCLEIREEGGEVFISLLVMWLTISGLISISYSTAQSIWKLALYNTKPWLGPVWWFCASQQLKLNLLQILMPF
jgi:hypothetical protein